MTLRHWDRSKNSRLAYFVRNGSCMMVPGAWWRARLDGLLGQLDQRSDAAELLERVHHYSKGRGPFALPASAGRPRCRLRGRKHNYHLDLTEYLRYFDPQLRVSFRFGDQTVVPEVPTLVKARPIDGPNENSILFKLNKVRHFVFVRDTRSFDEKEDRLVWRGAAQRPNRRRFLACWHGHPLCDVGDVSSRDTNRIWRKPYMSIAEQLRYKFVLSLEGNDVASNLKWILSSNSLCLMPRPRFETWFMEGQLVAGHHYVQVRDDFADVEEKVRYYSRHLDEARWIVRNAQAHVARFADRVAEDLVALLVLQEYFERSGQLAPRESPVVARLRPAAARAPVPA
jgi:hypothetical protein